MIATDLNRMFKPIDIFEQCIGKQEQHFASNFYSSMWDEILQTVLAEKDNEVIHRILLEFDLNYALILSHNK